MSWRETSNEVIRKALADTPACQTCEDVEALFRRISKEFYPFGERKMWPYKQWCKALHEFKIAYYRRHAIPRPGAMNMSGTLFEEVQP